MLSLRIEPCGRSNAIVIRHSTRMADAYSRANLDTSLKAVAGVTRVKVCPFHIYVDKGDGNCWNKIMPKIKKVMADSWAPRT